MTGYERVRIALSGNPPDRVPRGELGFEAELCARLLDVSGAAAGELPGYGSTEAAVRSLGGDLVGVWLSEGSWSDQMAHWAGRDLFVWGVMDGPFQGCAGRLGWERALFLVGDAVVGRGAGKGPSPAEEELVAEVERAVNQARLGLAAGADGVVMGEDVAYTRGLMVSQAGLDRVLLPLWSHFAAAVKSIPTRRDASAPLVLFHSDGYVEPLVEGLAAAGFDGLHSLEPEAGNDVGRLVGRHRGRMGFMGGISPDLLARGSDEEVIACVSRLLGVGRAGGLVVGTTTAVVPSWVPSERLRLAYRIDRPQ